MRNVVVSKSLTRPDPLIPSSRLQTRGLAGPGGRKAGTGPELHVRRRGSETAREDQRFGPIVSIGEEAAASHSRRAAQL
jgi:hypothetical protein